MDSKVKFLRGTAAEYAASTKDNDVFYYTTDTKKLYLGETEITGIEIDDTSTTATDKTWSAKKISDSIPTSLPANGGNAATVNNHTVESDVPANAVFTDTTDSDVVSGAAGFVSLDGLQGGVPFSEIVLGGNIVGQEVTLAVSGKNILPKPNWDGSVKTSNGVTFSVAGNGTITISGTTTGNATVHLMLTRMRVTKPLTLASNGTLSGIALIVRLTKDGETIYRTVYGKSVIEAGVIIEDIYLQQQKSGVKVSGKISPQLELGESATAYEPYQGSSVTVTPDSNPYTVPNDIRQQDGVNNVMVSAGTVQVTGVRRDAALKRVWDKLDELTAAVIVSNGE